MRETTTQIILDKRLTEETAGLFESLGLDLTTAIRVFLKKTVAEYGIPFEMRTAVPASETKQILEEMRDMEDHPEKYKSYRSFREGLDEVLHDVEY